MKQSYDFTAGPIGRPLLLYTLPLLLANVLQSFYQLVDLLVVGRIVGETGLAAMPCWSLGQAVTDMVGQNTGAGAMDRVRKITCTGLWCGLASTLILLLRLPVCWCLAFPLALGYPGLWIGQAISPLLPALIGGWFFHHTVGSSPAPHG